MSNCKPADIRFNFTLKPAPRLEFDLSRRPALGALATGADGVLLLGCEPGRCQFDTDAALVEQECQKARKLMKLLGLTEERLVVAHVPRGDGSDFVRRLTSFLEELEHLEPAVPGRA